MNDDRVIYEVWRGLDKKVQETEETVRYAHEMIESARHAAIRAVAKQAAKHVLYYIEQYDWSLDILVKVSVFYNTILSDEELDNLIALTPDAIFGVLHTETCGKACQKTLNSDKNRMIRPITLKQANSFVADNHRHNDPTVGCKFAIGLFEGKELVGVAISGRPVSKVLDNDPDMEILEILRVCTNGAYNGCSRLYGQVIKIARDMGYDKVITYTLESEHGYSLRAAGFTLEDAHCGGKAWTGQRSRISSNLPAEYKQRWAKVLSK